MFVIVILPIPIVALIGNRDDLVLLAYGVGIALLAAGIEIGAEKALAGAGLTLGFGLRAFLLFGLVEESLKLFAITAARRPTPRGSRLVRAALVCAVGFASTENAIYVIGFSKTLVGANLAAASLIRMFLPLAFHLADAPLLVSGYIVKGFKPVAGLVLATLLHGFYDLFASAPIGAGARVAYMVIVVGFFASAAIFRKAATL